LTIESSVLSVTGNRILSQCGSGEETKEGLTFGWLCVLESRAGLHSVVCNMSGV